MDLRQSLPTLLLASALFSACTAAAREPATPAQVESKKISEPRYEDVSIRVEDSENGIFSLMGGLASGQGFFVGASLSMENFDILDPPAVPQQQPPPSPAAQPTQPQPAPAASRFTFAIEPYFWWVGTEGNANIDSGRNQVHTSVDAVWESMDDAWGLRGDMGPEPGPYRILFDMNYQSLSKDTRNGSFHAYHSMFEGDVSWRTTDKYLFDPLVGLRYTELNTIRTFDTTNTATGESAGWFDPVVGARGRLPLAERFSLDWRADVGGFGVGSDVTYQLDAAACWGFSRAFRGFIGWRYLKVDYTSTDLDYHVATTGPYCGITFTF